MPSETGGNVYGNTSEGKPRQKLERRWLLCEREERKIEEKKNINRSKVMEVSAQNF